MRRNEGETMKNRMLGIAVAAAALGMGALPVGGDATQGAKAQQLRSGGNPADNQGRNATSSQLLAMVSGGGFGRPERPTYRNRNGCTVAEAKRRSIKFRNRLRAKGQFRKAVR